MAVAWTKEQQKVIEYRNRDILVSAAAGSGKTAVLVERIIKRITDRTDPIDIDRLLVVTFTKAAAAEMRERIGAAIEKAGEADPENFHLRRQSALLHNAMITTIDSFCLFVVRNHFEEIGLDPNFRIADEGELKLLELDVLGEVFEENYAAGREDFLALVDAYGGKRGDAPVRSMVGNIYRMSLSSPWPLEWIEGLARPYQAGTVEELFAAPLLRNIADTAGRLIADMADELKRLHALALAPDGPHAYAAAIEGDLQALAAGETCRDYADFRSFFGELAFGRLAPIRSFEGDVLKKEAVQSGRNEIKKELEALKKDYFSMEPQELLAQIARLRPMAEALVRLTVQYFHAMEESKRKKRIVDFPDLEHFALQIFVDSGTKQTRQTAKEFRAHFEELMIDEYQDSNQVQEEILKAISRESEGVHNMFMVGDVKQSIYRFRLARPELFMEKYASFTTEESSRQRIGLHQNFRSRSEVLDFCNDMFYKLMSRDLGGVGYDREAALYCGADYPEASGMEAELLLLDEADTLLEEQRESGRRGMEAHLTAERIHRLMRETMVYDRESGGQRKMRYSDIVILFRSLKDWGTDFARVLTEQGIPAHVESSTGYFSAIEVQTVLNMLRILDNPYQDIPMAAVLRSPMAGLDDEELAEIRLTNASASFSAAAFAAMQEAEEGKLAKFYGVYRELRNLRELPIHEFLQKLLDMTGYGLYAAAMPAGKRRSANLDMLMEKAIDYEKTSYRGLFHFVRYIDQLEKYEIDFGEADATGENADVVHIMTIHKSKGLEFPVVFVSGMGKHINQMETNERLVLHPDLGMGICEISGRPKVKKGCILHAGIADMLRRENLGEELRVLYVALTRAKEKLILTGMTRELDKSLQKYTGNVKPQKPVSYRQRAGAVTCLDWLIPAMLSYPGKYRVEAADPAALVWTAVEADVEKRMDYAALMEEIAAADEARVQAYGELFSYEYPYRGEAGKKSKYSVSELKHASMVRAFDKTEGETPEFLREERESYVPCFARMQEEGQSSYGVSPGALRGTAVHRVMECMDFAGLAGVDVADAGQVKAFVSRELARMREGGELSAELFSLIIPSAIEGFAGSGIAQRMAKAALRGELYREKPFVMQHEDVLVQGIIDVFWLEGDDIVLLDYKTDRVKEAEELIKRYETQLILYADALCRVFSGGTVKRRAKEKLIYSFCLQEVISL
ncbi:MAG: helicase-exonuclease AddAB subunit AddA [Muribaculaceae bacterium]|nr:helicase-exonuclease AddAB subunit AddA [Muribaculaceae bacterium]